MSDVFIHYEGFLPLQISIICIEVYGATVRKCGKVQENNYGKAVVLIGKLTLEDLKLKA